MIGIRTTPLGLLRPQEWLQTFPLIACQISSCLTTSIPAPWFCKQTLVSKPILIFAEFRRYDLREVQATRYLKRAVNYWAAVVIAALTSWLV
jgi:hypothetical protein